MSIDINSGFKVYATSPIDVRYSNNGIPYSSTSSACSSILSTSRFQGLTVLIGTSSTQPYPQEYWWQNGTSDSQLVLKQSLATGNITGSASTGYVAIWTGTTSVGYTSSLYWNSNINGLLVGTNNSNGTYSLQVRGDVYFRSNSSNNYGLVIQHDSPSISGAAIYSGTYKSAFEFYNLKTGAILSGYVADGGSILKIQNTSNDVNDSNTLLLYSTPENGSNGGTGSFKLLTLASYPASASLAIGSSLDQQYYYRDIVQFNLGFTSSSYRPLGLYGVIYESGTFSFENSSFRWKLTNNGNLSDYMKLNTDGLMIKSTVSRGTYSLQVNGSTIISGTSNSGGTIVPSFVGSAALVLDGNSACGIYSALSSGFQFFNQSSGCIINGDAQTLLDIQHRSNNPGKYGLMLRSFPTNNTSGSVGNYNLLTFLSSPSPSASSMFLTGSSLGQSYNAFDPNTLTYSYMGNFGCYMDSNTSNSISTSFRWSTSNAGSFYNNMILKGYGVGKSQLLIGYDTSQGTYSLQVNGDAYINGLMVGRGKTNLISNTIIGNKTAENLISTSAVNNVFIGYQAAYIISGTYGSAGNDNVVIGANSGYNLQGYVNTLIGSGAGNSLTFQYGVVCVGAGAGYKDNAGALPSYNQNTYIGYQSGYNNVSGQNNTFLGYQSGLNTTGGNNTFIGSGAGSTNTSGTNNVGIGNGVVVTGTNIIAIGNGTSGTVSNAVIIGNSGITSTTLYGNVTTNGSITAQTGGFDSDIRLKSDIVYNPIIEGIDSIKSASYVIGGNSHIGYIAQEVENIVPSSIIRKEDGYLALNYNEVLVAKVAYLENKVKELYDIIERNGLK